MSEHLETPGAAALRNRLVKNLRHLGRWARRSGVTCWRLYDADLPEYAAAIDLYAGRAHVQEYAAPPSIDAGLASARLRDLLRITAEVVQIPATDVYVKVRRPQRGPAQYERLAASGEFFEVREGPAVLLVNLRDYLDTGLFLDHRDTRALIRAGAAGKRFLNLFCYTAAATVHAALGGARSSLSLDLSNTYLDWAARNLERNGLDAAHRLERADVVQWLLEGSHERFDLAFLDPPTFSNSKSMARPMDIQRDHPDLIHAAMRLLAPGGELIFSTNHRRFRLDHPSLAGLEVTDLTARTIPKDFERNPRIHSAWQIRREASGAPAAGLRPGASLGAPITGSGAGPSGRPPG